MLEQHSLGLPIPSDKLITIERWDKYVIIQASFGHKVNRVLARVVAYLISERLGQSVAVHQDPYRIILEVDASPDLVRTTLEGLVDKDLGELARIGGREVGHLQAPTDPRREEVRSDSQRGRLRERLHLGADGGAEGHAGLRGGDKRDLPRRLRRRGGARRPAQDEGQGDRGPGH